MLPDMIVPTYVQMLTALSAWLAKAEAAKPDGGAEALLSARLAPDMFPLSTQVRFACVQALEGVHRLLGEPLPPLVGDLLNEGRGAGDQPGSIAEAKARIAETLALVEKLAPAIPDVDPGAPLVHDLPMGIVFDLTALQYVRDWTLPQFYFHLMIAYAILRAQGVDLGKLDYIPHMVLYVRPGTMPKL